MIKTIFLLISLLFILPGCIISPKYGTSNKEPLLLLPEKRFIFCQDGKIFRDMPSYPKRNIYYLVTQLNKLQMGKLKKIIGNKEISFSGDEYKIPENIFPAQWPDKCIINYNGCCSGTKKINYKKCKKLHSKIDSFVKDEGFNIKSNYKNLVEISIDKNMSIPIKGNDFSKQVNKLCDLPMLNGRPLLDGVKWKEGKDKFGTGINIYSDIK